MSANVDASTLLSVRFKEPREGSCLTKEMVAELASLIEVSFKADADPAAVRMKVSTDANNLSSLDSSNAILTPAPKQFSDELTWDAGTTTELTFDGWSGQGIDALQSLINLFLMVDSGEAGKDVKGDPTGIENLRPSIEITSITSAQIKCKVYNLTSDAVVRLRLVQNPTASDSP